MSAGLYQGIGGSFVRSVTGCFYNVVGFPVYRYVINLYFMLINEASFTWSFFVSVFYAQNIPLLLNEKYSIFTKRAVFFLLVSRSFQRGFFLMFQGYES